jgi:hypothetical protein
MSSVSEVSEIQVPFAYYLDRRGLVYIRSRSDRPTTTEKGVPDFLIFSGILFLAIECKGEKTPISAAQKRWHAKMEAVGGKVHIARSLAECVTLTENWLNGVGTGAAVPRVNNTGLYRHGDGVFKRDGDAFAFVRKVSLAGDKMLPPVT